MSGSVRNSIVRARELTGDVVGMEIRTGLLVSEIVALESRAGSIRGFLDTAPLVGDQRYAEAAGVAVGSAVSRTATAGREDVRDSVKAVAQAVGSTELIGALLDLAGAALAWSTILSLADEEGSAGNPRRAGARIEPGRSGVSTSPPHRAGACPAEMALRDGMLTAREVFLGRCPAYVRRQLAPLAIARIITADATLPQSVMFSLPVHGHRRLGGLTAAERHDVAAELVLCREREMQPV